MIYHNSNEEYPEPLSMFSEEEWKELVSDHLTIENVHEYIQHYMIVSSYLHPSGRFARCRMILSKFSLLMKKKPPAHYDEVNNLYIFLKDLWLGVENKDTISSIFEPIFGLEIYNKFAHKNYIVNQVEILPNSSMPKLSQDTAMDMIGEYCNSNGLTFKNGIIIFPYSTVTASKIAVEEYPEPLSMFNKEEWGSLFSESLSADNWFEWFPDVEVSRSTYDDSCIYIVTSDVQKFFHVFQKNEELFTSDIDLIKGLIDLGNGYGADKIRFGIDIYEDYEWGVDSIMFSFDDDHDRDTFFMECHDKFSELEVQIYENGVVRVYIF